MGVSIKDGVFRLENSLFRRELKIDGHGLSTISIFNKLSGREYLKRGDCPEFSFVLDGRGIASLSKSEVHVLDGSLHEAKGALSFRSHRVIADDDGAETLRMEFDVLGANASLAVNYKIWPDLCGCRKWIDVANTGRSLLHLRKFTIESLNLCAGDYIDQEYYKDDGFTRCPTAFSTVGTDDIIQIHNPRLEEGLFIGLEIPVPLCYFLVYPRWVSGVSCGYSQSAMEFNKYLAPGETFKSGAVLLHLYRARRNSPRALNRFREMIRRVLPGPVAKPGIMYCTWLPFLKSIDEHLIDELAANASAMGFQTFVLDDGWFTMDKWKVDKAKFPNGIERLSKSLKNSGLRFGLWINLGSDYGAPGSRPEDSCLRMDGERKEWNQDKFVCRCLASKHQEFASAQLVELAKAYGVDYFKMDFSCIYSPYGFLPHGCSSRKHAHHRNAADAPYEQYNSLFEIRKAVKSVFPDLAMDFSFECFGAERPGVAALQYSDLHHASNFNTIAEFDNARQIRLALYRYAHLLPTERILGSLICLNGSDDVENLLSSFAGAPLVSGDLRLIPAGSAGNIARLCAMFARLNASASLSEFAAVNDDFLASDRWDGFARYSTDGRGFAALFANDSGVSNVDLAIEDMAEVSELHLSDALTGESLGRCSGKELSTGMKIQLNNKKCRCVIIRPRQDPE